MDVPILLEQRFQRTPDGAVWTDAAFDNVFWNRHLGGLESSVQVTARVEAVQTVPGNSPHRVSSAHSATKSSIGMERP
jgi:hypothetical protein